MTTATLSHIGTSSEPWGENNLVFIDLAFTDHDPATLTTNEQGKASRLADLAALQGKPAEWNFGTNSKGKPTVKIHKADGFGGGGKKGGWQPKSVEERAEIMSMNMLTAASALCQNEWSAIRFDRAIEMVTEGMTRLLTYTRGTLKASGTEGPSVTGKGATASSVPDDNVEGRGHAASRALAADSLTPDVSARDGAGGSPSTTTSGASAPLDATPDRAGDGTAPRPQEPPSDDEPEQGGAVSSRHVHEWVTKNPLGGDLIPGWVRCLHCPISRRATDPEVVDA